MKDLTILPDNLPVPEDDRACAHLEGSRMPAIALLSTNDRTVDLSKEAGIAVVYLYPMTGSPEMPPMPGWNEIPGARGCTPQTCAFQNHHAELLALGVNQVYGASSQSLEEQKSAVKRLQLPFELLNDSAFVMTDALRLPTFNYQQLKLIKRLTLIIQDGTILKVFYPVFPPNENAAEVMAWFKAHQA